MDPLSSISNTINNCLSQSAQASPLTGPVTSSSKACSDWLGRTISTWPDWLSVPTFAVLQSMNLDVQAPDARERQEIRQNIINELSEIILQYRVPADIEEVVRKEI